VATVTKTYAQAFADVVFASGISPGKTFEEMQALAELVAGSKELREVWHSPAISPAQKRAVLDALVGRIGISRPVRNFLAVVIDHRRTQFLAPIVKEFELELDRRLGFTAAEITSARDLNPSERQSLEGQVERLTGKKVRARYLQDRSILGGAVVRLGSTIYDGSVKGQLDRIREQLASI
jgi:F-type H+-transporting ATPase subunit delta